MNKYQKHVACSYGYKLVSVDDKFSKAFTSYLGKDVQFNVQYKVYNFISDMIEESKYCNDMMKNILTRNLWWLKKTMKILKTLLNVGFAIIFVGGDVKVKDHSHMTGKYRESTHRVVISGLN